MSIYISLLSYRDEKRTPSPSFGDFEKEWFDLGVDWALPILESQYSPLDPYLSLTGNDGTTQDFLSQTTSPSSLSAQTKTVTSYPP